MQTLPSNRNLLREDVGTRFIASAGTKQIPVLNGIRAIACLSVLFFHIHLGIRSTGIWNPLPNIHDIDIHNMPAMLTYFAAIFAYAGDSGAILFFLLSGFLLFLPYAKLLLFETPWTSLHKFYIRRIFRILPGYYAILVVIIPTSAMLYYWIEQPGIRLGEWLICKLERPKKGNTL